MLQLPRCRFGVALILACLAPAGCGEPPEVTSPDETNLAPKPQDATKLEPKPEPPQWAASWIGQRLDQVFPRSGESCMGYIGNVEARFLNEEGVRVDGWGWSISSQTPYQEFVAVDDAGVIHGAGNGGIESLDVPAAVPSVTNPNVGFMVTTSQISGNLRVFGITADKTAACQLGPPLDISAS